MLILVPPSETKTRPTASDAPTVSYGSFAGSSLTKDRRTMLAAAQRTATGARAAERLGAPPSAPELVTRMAHLDTEPAGAPLEVYSGVLYDALGTISVPEDARLLITSALGGVVDAALDTIPAYRLSASSDVSRLGKVSAWWKPRLEATARSLTAASSVIVDCRSGAYTQMMPLVGDKVMRVGAVAVRDGRRSVVSHDAKRYRGLVARALLEEPVRARTADEVVDQLRASLSPGLDVEFERGARTHALTVVDTWSAER